MNINFKAQIITKPEQFYRQTDSEEDRKYIKDVFELTQKILTHPKFSRFTQNDTVEFVRKKSKQGFAYKMVYKTPDLESTEPNKKVFENIEFSGNNLRSVFNIKDIFYQYTGIVAIKRGLLESLPLFTPYKEIRDKAFDLTKEQSEIFPL